MLSDMISRIITDARKQRRSVTLYFHNFGRFDGILLLRHLTLYHPALDVKPLVRNSRIYEIELCWKVQSKAQGG